MNTKNERPLHSPTTYRGLAKAAQIAKGIGRFLLLYGQVGVGKTAAGKVIHEAITGRDGDGKISHNEWANGESGYAVVNCTGQSPDSLAGFLVPDHDTRSGWFTQPEHWPLESVVGEAHITLCVDEVDKLSTDAVSVMLGLLDANDTGTLYLGTHKLGPNVNVYFTANGREHGSTSSKVIPAPLVTRCYARSLVADVAGWLTGYAIPNGLAKSPVVAWLTSYGEEWFSPVVEGRWDGRSIACPRQWAAAAKKIDNTTPFDEAVNEILWPCVGYDAANACAAFIALIHKVKPQLDKLKNGGALPTDHRDQYAVLFAAIRTITKDYPDTGAAIKKGELDWFVTALLHADSEIREWAVPLASGSGITLKFHPQFAQLAA
jgi:hypothetical protein